MLTVSIENHAPTWALCEPTVSYSPASRLPLPACSAGQVRPVRPPRATDTQLLTTRQLSHLRQAHPTTTPAQLPVRPPAEGRMRAPAVCRTPALPYAAYRLPVVLAEAMTAGLARDGWPRASPGTTACEGAGHTHDRVVAPEGTTTRPDPSPISADAPQHQRWVNSPEISKDVGVGTVDEGQGGLLHTDVVGLVTAQEAWNAWNARKPVAACWLVVESFRCYSLPAPTPLTTVGFESSAAGAPWSACAALPIVARTTGTAATAATTRAVRVLAMDKFLQRPNSGDQPGSWPDSLTAGRRRATKLPARTPPNRNVWVDSLARMTICR